MELFKGKRNQLLTTISLDLGNMLVGYMAGWSAPVVEKLQKQDQTPLPYTLSLTTCSWIASTHFGGIIIGPFLAGSIANKFGRKKCTILAALIYLVGSVLLQTAHNFAMILVGRFVTGIGSGVISVNNLVYIGEISSPNIRGILLTSTGAAHCFSMVLGYIMGLFSYATMGYVLLALSLLYLLGSIYIPESPVYHLFKGNEDKSIATLHYLGRKSEVEEFVSINEKRQEEEWSWRDVFTDKCNRRSLLIAGPLSIFQYCSGMIVISYFLTTIFEMADSSIKPEIGTIIIGVTQFLGTLVVPQLIERAGRRLLLLLSIAGCFLIFVLLGIYFCLRQYANSLVASLGWIPLVLLVIVFFVYSIGLNIIPNTLLGEVFKPNVRSIGSSISLSLAALTGTLTLACFGYIAEKIGMHVVFWIFTVVNAAAFVFTALVVPETKGMSLSEILIMLSN